MNQETVFQRRGTRGVCTLLAASLLVSSLGGCAGQFGGVNLAVDPADPCGGDRQRFAQSQGYFTREIVMKTVAGGLIGAGTGALIGAAAGGQRGAVIGAVTGLGAGIAAGLAAGYWQKLQQTNADQIALSRQVNGDLSAESSQMSEIAYAFSNLRSCRFGVAEQIKANARRGLIANSQAQAQLSQERAWFNQEIQAAQEAGLNMQRRDEQFAYAANQLPPESYAPPPSSSRRTTSRTSRTASAASSPRTVATETIPQKRNSFENSVQSAQAQSATAFSLDASTSWLQLEMTGILL